MRQIHSRPNFRKTAVRRHPAASSYSDPAHRRAAIAVAVAIVRAGGTIKTPIIIAPISTMPVSPWGQS